MAAVLFKLLIIGLMSVLVSLGSGEVYALGIAKKNVRSTLSGQKLSPVSLNRVTRGTSLASLRARAGAAKPIPLQNTQQYRYQKADGYQEDVGEELVIEPFAHVRKKADPFGIEAPVQPMLKPKESHIIRDEVPRMTPFKRVPITQEMSERFSPELEKSEELAEAVTYHHRWPIEESQVQRVSSDFGPREHPVTGKMAFHAGIDIAAKAGTPVRASMDGRVNAIGTHARLGKYVRLDHPDGTYSLYGHLKSQSVSHGQVVLQGEVIGAVGSTGRSTGPHLDYSLRRHSQPMDPMEVLAIPEELKVRELSALR